MYLPVSAECISEKSIRVCGKGTVPGSETTALKCDIVKSSTSTLKITVWNVPHKLEQILFIKECILSMEKVYTYSTLSVILSILQLHNLHRKQLDKLLEHI